MYYMAQGWLVLTVTDSPFWVGATSGFSGLGLISFAVIGGVLVDRVDRRKLLVIGQLIQVLMATTVGFLALTGHIELWHILLVGFADGVVVSVKAPANMAVTLDVVGRERLLSATGLRFLSMTLMGIAAPLVLAGVVSAFAIGWAYLIIAGVRLRTHHRCTRDVSHAVLQVSQRRRSIGPLRRQRADSQDERCMLAVASAGGAVASVIVGEQKENPQQGPTAGCGCRRIRTLPGFFRLVAVVPAIDATARRRLRDGHRVRGDADDPPPDSGPKRDARPGAELPDDDLGRHRFLWLPYWGDRHRPRRAARYRHRWRRRHNERPAAGAAQVAATPDSRRGGYCGILVRFVSARGLVPVETPSPSTGEG